MIKSRNFYNTWCLAHELLMNICFRVPKIGYGGFVWKCVFCLSFDFCFGAVYTAANRPFLYLFPYSNLRVPNAWWPSITVGSKNGSIASIVPCPLALRACYRLLLLCLRHTDLNGSGLNGEDRASTSRSHAPTDHWGRLIKIGRINPCRSWSRTLYWPSTD